VSCTLHAIHLEKKDEERLPPRSTTALYMKIMSGKAGAGGSKAE
jgi:hypothetical protein